MNFIDHYKYLECKAIANADCPQCIERFDCPRLPLQAKELDMKKCHVATKTYKIGESILSKRKFCKYCTCVDAPLPPTGTPDYEDNNNEEDNGDEEETTQPNDGPVSDFNATAILANRPPPSANYSPVPLDTNYEARVTCVVSASPYSALANAPDSNEYCYYKENECRYLKHCISKEKLEKGNFSSFKSSFNG